MHKSLLGTPRETATVVMATGDGEKVHLSLEHSMLLVVDVPTETCNRSTVASELPYLHLRSRKQPLGTGVGSLNK